MSEHEKFLNERRASIASYSSDDDFLALSRDWLRESMQRRYVYSFDWMGRPIIQYPQDIVSVQEIIWQTRPDVVVETGIAHGGSLVLSASMLALLDYSDAVERGEMLDPQNPGRFVVGVDIDIRKHNRIAVEEHPMSSRIRMIEGSSIADDVVRTVKSQVADGKRVMVCLDSMHTQDHVIAELNAYAPLVTPGCYCVVFDTFVEFMPEKFFPDRPWDVGNNPMTAVRQWIDQNPEFVIDLEVHSKLSVSAAPLGYLRRL